MKNIYALILFLFAFCINSCLIRPEEVINPWDDVLGFQVNTPIKTMYTDGIQLNMAADDEFLRISSSNTLAERRPLPLPYRFFNRPTMGKFCFSRIVRKEAQGNPIVEIRMNNNANFVLDLDFSTLGGVANPSVFPEEDSRYSCAFNDDGDILMVPGVNISENRHDFYLIRLNFDATGNTIVSHTVTEVSIPELPAAFGSISHVEFINGNFYVVSLDGSFRVTPSGGQLKLFQTHLWDYFNSGGRFYAVDRGSRIYESVDNGVSWEEIDEEVRVQQVETVGSYVLTHQAVGFPFTIASDDFKSTNELLLNADFPQDFAAYRQVLLFDGKFFMSVQKRLYCTDDLMEVEE